MNYWIYQNIYISLSEWLSLKGLSRTADSDVHVVHINRVIIACTWEFLSLPTKITHNLHIAGLVVNYGISNTIDGYPATPLHCPRDRSPPVAGCYFSGSPCAGLVSRLQSTSPTSRPEFRLGNREQWSPTGHVFPSNSQNNPTIMVKWCQ